MIFEADERGIRDDSGGSVRTMKTFCENRPCLSFPAAVQVAPWRGGRQTSKENPGLLELKT